MLGVLLVFGVYGSSDQRMMIDTQKYTTRR